MKIVADIVALDGSDDPAFRLVFSLHSQNSCALDLSVHLGSSEAGGPRVRPMSVDAVTLGGSRERARQQLIGGTRRDLRKPGTKVCLAAQKGLEPRRTVYPNHRIEYLPAATQSEILTRSSWIPVNRIDHECLANKVLARLARLGVINQTRSPNRLFTGLFVWMPKLRPSDSYTPMRSGL
jgi:hypothetical protein